MSKFDFKGILTALVTPFKDGKVDFDSFQVLLEDQLTRGIEGLVVNGTTGESPTLSKDEVKALFLMAQKRVAGTVPILVGTGSNCTRTTIEFTNEAASWGADMALVVVPYYNKPPQAGLIRHFTAVAEATNIPIMLYNVPGRTVISMSEETVAELSRHPSILGIKEASGEPNMANRLRSMCEPEFVLLSGDDASCIEFMLQGGDGVISVLSHVIPEELVSISKKARNFESSAVDDYIKYDNLNGVLCLDSNPIPVKTAMKYMGVIKSDEVRSPLVEMDATKKEKLLDELIVLELAKKG